jgi:hypothetical protein
MGSTTPANPAIYDHGITHGGSDALDAQTLWIFAAVRPLHQPQGDPGALAAGRSVFTTHAPYLHRGQAETLADVFRQHGLGSSTIQGELNASDRANLLEFLRSIDGTTASIPSGGDTFRDSLRLEGTCVTVPVSTVAGDLPGSALQSPRSLIETPRTTCGRDTLAGHVTSPGYLNH